MHKRHGAELLANACSMELEGIIAKHTDRPYHSPGRTGNWLKIKCVQSESFMIVDYERSRVACGGIGIGSLLLAARKGEDWVYVGSVGTWFGAKDAAEDRPLLRAILALGRRLRSERPNGAITLAAMSLLGTLDRLGPMPAVQLPAEERLRPQSLTRIIANLVHGSTQRMRPLIAACGRMLNADWSTVISYA